jgi:hypothetical protein
MTCLRSAERGNRRRSRFLIRRVALLTLLVACLVVPVVAVAVNAFGSHGQGGGGASSELVCSQATTPCQLPKPPVASP